MVIEPSKYMLIRSNIAELVTNSDQDWELAHRLRNWANNAVKSAKSDFINRELDDNKSDPKKFWQNIREVLPALKAGNIDIKNPIIGELLDRDMQALVINDFFANIGLKFRRTRYVLKLRTVLKTDALLKLKC